MKHTYTKNQPAHQVNVGLDLFGNAIPEGKSLRIVKRHDMVLKPSPKRVRDMAQVKTARLSVLKHLLPWRVVSVERQPPVALDGVSERLEQAFKRLHQEFNEREQQLETKMHALTQTQQRLSATKTKRQVWLLPVILIAGAAGGYMMYIMSSMQGSMIAMSGNINTMNQSMYYMNNNVAYMSGNVAQMNQKVGTLAQAAAPMGDAAATVSPFMKMFKSVMPF